MNRRNFLASMAAASPLLAQQNQDTEAFDRTGGVRRKARTWFSDAGFGLFISWGICAVREVELGWGIYGDVGGKNGSWPVENYIAQANVFNPQSYDPDLWLAAAAKAGFRYAVMTTRHHDGYAMWPSNYGNFSTKEHMGGRDLVRPYVEACRRHGIKVGLYYSPCNWLFNPQGWPHLGYPMAKTDFRYRRPERTLGTPRYVADSRDVLQRHFEVLYAYVKGQVSELLTNYGKIDILWWDGYDWPVGVDIHGQEMDAWVRKLQPGLITNDRYRLWAEHPTLGDFSTEFENRNPEKPPEGAWEQCEAVYGGWAYRGADSVCKPTSYLIDRMVQNRAWGGNYLPDFGPRVDGTMAPPFYERCSELAAWMKHSGVSVNGTAPLADLKQSSVPTTVKDKTWYLHLLGYQRRAKITGQPAVAKATMLRTGAPAKIEQAEGSTVVTMPIGLRPPEDEVIAVQFV